MEEVGWPPRVAVQGARGDRPVRLDLRAAQAMTTLLVASAMLITCLTLYSLAHYLCVAMFLLGRPPRRCLLDHPEDPVSVLVPGRNEGESALRVLASLARQDHRGPLTAYLLVKDRDDSSIPFFAQLHPDLSFDMPAPATIELPATGGCRTVVAYTGLEAKGEKINWMAARLSTPYLAILDGDHQARPDWIRTSLCLLHEQKARIIQASRGPLDARGFFSLWDSLHQHVGCELFNVAFSALGLPLFFTGTTAVMETSLLQAHPLSRCLTEDVYFSYAILRRGVRIIHNPYSGSDEETSPDLHSFLARRRRWSNGHTVAFLSHLSILWAAPVRLRERLQFLLHGMHYLVAAAVFALHLIIGLLFTEELSPVSAGAGALASLLLAWLVARTQVWESGRCTWTQRLAGGARRAAELLVIFTWLAPAVLIAMNLAQAVLTHDPARTLLPGPRLFQAIGLVGLCAPLVVLLAGMAGFRQLGLGSLLAVVTTYIAAFYLDLCGVLLGLTDAITGGARWQVVHRAPLVAAAAPGRGGARTEPVGLKQSWRTGRIMGSTRATLKRGVPRMTRTVHVLLFATGCLLCGGALYAPYPRIEVAGSACRILQQDDLPWILPAKQGNAYCRRSPSQRHTRRTGSFETLRDDALTRIDGAFWDRLDTTFPCNKAVFAPQNIVVQAGGGVQMGLERAANRKGLTAGSIATKDLPGAKFTYGRFETRLKPARASGVITAFFLYRFDPWQEIDAEVLGKDPTKIILNVYYNPGEPGDLYNYGYRGTPVAVDLGFDASLDFHRYAIEWEPEEIRWFVDGQLIHVRHAGRPTPIPHLPMRFFVNMWPCCSEDLAGVFDPASVPTSAGLRSVTLSRWRPSLGVRLREFVGAYFSRPGDAAGWRSREPWIHP